jgi:hypothetical protein
MADRILAGYETVDSVTPVQLYAGEKQPVTTQGVAAAGYVFGMMNAQGGTSKFPVVAEVGGELVPWNPLADSNAPGAFATGTVTFSTAVPSANETVTINGEVITFKAAADPDEFEVTIGATLALTAAALAAFINEHRNEFGTDFPITATSSAGVVTVRAPGDAGEAVTLAEAGANIAVSGGTLASGSDNDATPGGANLPVAILPHALDTTANGYNAAVDTPMFVEGVFNYEALDLPEGTTYAEIRAAFRRSGITIQKLY